MLIPLHGIASRHDLPLPFSYLVVGAGLALTVSFVVLLLAWRSPRFARVGGLELPRLTQFVDAPATRVVTQLLVLAAYGWAALALVAGQDLLTNPVFGFVYVWMWVGLIPLSLLLGQVWRATNPVRTVHRLLCAVARVDPEQGLLRLPRRLGVWPAALGIFGFGWLELVQPDRTTLAVLRVWALGWFVLLVLGAIVFGARWIAAADPFEAYARTIAQLSPWRRVGDTLRLVNPLAGLTAWRPPPGAVGLVAALLGSTAFDSFANTSWWIQKVQSSEVVTVVWATGGLAALILLVLATFALAAASIGRDGGGQQRLRPSDGDRARAGGSDRRRPRPRHRVRAREGCRVAARAGGAEWTVADAGGDAGLHLRRVAAAFLALNAGRSRPMLRP